MKNIKIQRLLGSAFIFLLVLFLVVGGVGILNAYNSNRDTALIYDNGLVPIQLLGRIHVNQVKINKNNALIAYDHNPMVTGSRKKELDSWAAENGQILAEFEKYVSSDTELAQIAEYKKAVAAYLQLSEQSFEFANSGDYSGAISLDSKINAAMKDLESRIDALIEMSDNQAVTAKKKIAGNTQTALYLTIGLLLFAVVISLYMTIAIPRSMRKPLRELVNVARSVADGNVDVGVAYRSKNEFGELAASIEAVIENLRRLTQEANRLTDQSSAGNFHARAEAQNFGGSYCQILEGVNTTLETIADKVFWYESLLNSMFFPVQATDNEPRYTFVNKMAADMAGQTKEEIIGQECSAEARYAVEQLRAQNNSQFVLNHKGREYNIETSYLQDAHGVPVGFVQAGVDVTKDNRKVAYQKVEVERLAKNLDLLAQGVLTLDFAVAPADEYTDLEYSLFNRINLALRETRESLAGYIEEISVVLEQISKGNLNVTAAGAFKGEFAQIKESLNRIIASLNDTVRQINSASAQVLSGAGQVAGASHSLSQGAMEQASSVQELSATIENISAQINKSAKNAQTAHEISDATAKSMDKAREQMEHMVDAMGDIDNSSQRINKIIKTIDDIAFQTNILALNAAVEAARAGEAGKGFAVVADEVRNLASKSAEAAKDTASLIESSIVAVEKGTKLANATAVALNAVVEESVRASEMIQGISQTAKEQATAIGQATQGVSQISGVVQMNSSTASQTAAASEELSGQASMLNELVGRFRLRKQDT